MVMDEQLNDLREMRLSHTHKPRSWRLFNAKQASNKSLEKVIDKEDIFFFRSYSYTNRAIMKPQLFEKINEEVNLMHQEACPPRGQTLLAILTPTLFAW